MRENITAFICGLIFAIGLGVSQMTNPEKILGFLNVLGPWDPTLLIVFIAATGTYFVGYHWLIDQSITREVEKQFQGKKTLEPRLIIGSILFGLGWGIAGLCPGPAVVDLVSGVPGVYLYFVAMLLGMGCVQLSFFRI